MSKSFWKKQLYIKQLTPIEHIILWVNIGLSVGLFIAQISIYKTFNHWEVWLTLLASILSILAVMAGIKKKPLCPFLGVICSLILIPIAWSSNLYGTMIMYGINVIIQTTSFITWFKNTDKTASIKPNKIVWWQTLVYVIILIGLTALFTWVEGIQGFQDFMSGRHVEMPPLETRIFDAAVLMFTVGCCLPMIFRWNNVWIIYIFNDGAQACLWICKIVHENNHSQIFSDCIMLVSVLGLLVASILGLIRWIQSDKNNKK